MLNENSFAEEKYSMTHLEGIKLSLDDSRIVANNRLGAPLTIYRLKRSLIQLYYWIGIFFLLISIAILITIIIISFQTWHEQLNGPQGPSSEYVQFLLSQYLFIFPALNAFVLCLTAQLVGWLLLKIVVPQARNKRIIICEDGLLCIEWKITGQQLQAIHWTEIQTITKNPLLPDYSILYFNGAVLGTLSLSFEYENLSQQIALIRQKMNKRNEM